MPAGRGAATVAWAAETDYNAGTAGTPTYRLPGTNAQVQDLSLARQAETIRVPDDVEPVDFVTNQFDNAVGIQFVMTDDEFHDLVFNDSSTGFQAGAANSAEWYFGADLTSGDTVERQVQGWVPGSCDINYNGSTDLVTVTLSGPYAEEDRNTSITPGTIASNSGDEVPGHGAELKINSTRVAKLTSATLSFSGLSALIPDSNTPKPVDAVAGTIEESVSLSAIYDGSDLYEFALGSSGTSTTEDLADSTTATVTFDRGGTIANYSFGTVKPVDYAWEDLVQAEPALGESVEFVATDVTASSP